MFTSSGFMGGGERGRGRGGNGNAKTIISPNTSFGDIIKLYLDWALSHSGHPRLVGGHSATPG